MTEPKPSFLRGLFQGAIHESLVFPYPPGLEARHPDEAQVVRRLIGALKDMQDSGLIDSARFDEEETIPENVIRALADTGWLALSIPKAYGGLGLSATGYARVFETLSRVDGSLAVLVGVHCGLGSKAIVLFGNDEQKARYLPMLARGETLAAYALTEPETGSDAQNIKTVARLSEDGSRWILNGRKIWIGNGHRAGVIATFAQTQVDRRGEAVMRPTAFIIRPDMPGFRVVETVHKLGIRGSTQAQLAYENLQVPTDHVLGTVGKGFLVAVNVLNGGRLSLGAGCTGGSKELITLMTHYASERVQFGHPLADFEITQRKLSSLAADTYAADAMLGLLAATMDRGDADYALEAACLKVFASDLVWRAADEMVQVAGGRGYVKPYPYERLLRNARINRIFEGANEILRLFIALNGIQAPAERLTEIGAAIRKPLKNFGLVSGYVSSRIFGGRPDLTVGLHPSLAENKRYLEKHTAELQAETDRAITKYRKAIVERQLVLERLANMAIDLYATAATISRTQRLIEERSADGARQEIALCDLFCVTAGHRFREHRQALSGREDEVDDTRRTIAAALRAARGYFVEDAILDADEEPGAKPASALRSASGRV
ncbi:MAG TPA: acyl-CoA dehydrogenase family protein [Gemmatimonadaceae bacterium]|jgi:alkylation response protein AidB-like acyl-CoA dehydrogenase|nr:acyl-CoA dehydrogenase family protein [Gemmatimonadaceae bacterium]